MGWRGRGNGHRMPVANPQNVDVLPMTGRKYIHFRRTGHRKPIHIREGGWEAGKREKCILLERRDIAYLFCVFTII